MSREHSNQNIAVLAGIFDPVHLGHQTIVQKVLDDDLADKVLVIAEKLPQHKPNATAYQHRQKMLELAFVENPKVEVIEAPISEHHIKPFFAWMSSRYSSSEFAWIVGSDVLPKIPKWADFDKLPEYRVNKIISFERPGFSGAKIDANAELQVLKLPEDIRGISSSKIRENAKLRKQAMNPSAYEYARSHQLY